MAEVAIANVPVKLAELEIVWPFIKPEVMAPLDIVPMFTKFLEASITVVSEMPMAPVTSSLLVGEVSPMPTLPAALILTTSVPALLSMPKR